MQAKKCKSPFGAFPFNNSSISLNSGEISFDDLNDKKVNNRVYLFSCHGGEGDHNTNVAWIFAEKTNSTVRACSGGVSYSKIFGKYYARTDGTGIWKNFYLNKKGDKKWIIGF